tara:strand:+ start:151 stop:630 length:480 start_codon:yes stop_codon:yes gene_type:complete
MKTIYNFSVQDAELKDIPLKDYKDKVLLVVNVASYCGLTYQYESLEKLYKKYQNKDFEILGFPCNQFAFQEPGNNKDIKKFCDSKYGITFKIFNKINVNGSKEDPFFTFLKEKKPGVAGTKPIKWNFTKFLINKDGEVVDRFSPQVEPIEIESNILELL